MRVFSKSARNYSSLLKAPIAIGDKIRRSHDEKAEVTEILGDVKGRNALIVDDFTITLGSLADTARVSKRTWRREDLCLCYACAVDGKGVKSPGKQSDRKIDRNRYRTKRPGF